MARVGSSGSGRLERLEQARLKAWPQDKKGQIVLKKAQGQDSSELKVKSGLGSSRHEAESGRLKAQKGLLKLTQGSIRLMARIIEMLN